MASKTVVVGSQVGLHARPASIIAEAAGGYDEEIFLFLEGEEDDETDAASSLMQWRRSPLSSSRTSTPSSRTFTH